eukprot:CAMPEP_0203680170 /NCGR_PEP_ID=MMETSP0090-20130426/38259_1 /ASSEMBLY_ACC=CAM_ASM_001088 /TAXON_ID=426623 /ORGANISM="Chaetoceros affinis, Strain CCMP159" /LENGTH=326 /DNA_ID=CAMNT_0050548115 /DNA_START=172 /DNA_END=1152 /DNA_ORIENTATION=-
MIVRTLEESLTTTFKDRKHRKHRENSFVADKQCKQMILNNICEPDLNDSTGNKTNTTVGNLSDLASCSSMTSLSNSYMQNARVRFDDVTVRGYFMMPGDNPSVARGTPVTIEWKHNYEEIHNFELYEKNRQNVRRMKDQMKMPPNVRQDLLIKNGYSISDLRQHSKQATIARRERYRTIELLHTSNVEEKIEGLKSVVKRLFRSKEEKEEERRIRAYYMSDQRGSNNRNKDIDTTQRTGNRSSKLANGDPLDISRRGEKYDLIPKTNGQVHNLNDLDKSRHGKRQNLLGNQDTVPELEKCSLDSSLDSLNSSSKMKKTDLETGRTQ